VTGELSGTNPILLGVDGGSTKTIALLARVDGTVVGAGRAFGMANIYVATLERVVGVLEAAVDAAVAAAGGPRQIADVGARVATGPAVFSLAGCDWPEDRDELLGALRRRWPTAEVVNDAIGALRAAVPDGPGVVVVCGTGAASGARGRDGRTWHSGFWQEAQGSDQLGDRALAAIYRAELGVGPPTTLTERVLAALGEPTVEAVLRRRTVRAAGRLRTAGALAPLLLDAAEEGDPVAAGIVSDHGRALGETALAAAMRVGIQAERFPLALTGGVFRHPGRTLESAIVEVVQTGAPGAAPTRSTLEPAIGALLLAFDQAGVPVDRQIERRIRDTAPGSEFFDTHPDARDGA
jgi:N-acetylglucosamine kinase-like BadF-type ATPase